MLVTIGIRPRFDLIDYHYEEEKMRTISLAIFSLVFFSFFSLFAYASETGIEVKGTAKESVVPDIATISFSINGRGKELAVLKKEIDVKTADTVSLSKKLGVKTKNITSSKISIHPQYNYQTKSFIGYEVSRTIMVVLNDLSKYSGLVNGAIKAGITTINNITFDTKNRDSLERKALGLAIKAARQKAEILATSSNVTLGKVLYVKEEGGPIRLESYAFRQRANSVGMAKGAFEPGEISVTSTVLVRYSIK